jgi:septum formation inhibitor-activating ATPase MinD
VGKTTTAVNLAASLALHGARVLVLDLDPQGNASTALDVDHRVGVPSVYDVLVDGRPLAEVVRPAGDMPGLFCAPATIDLAGAEIELVPVVARELRLAKALRAFDTSNLDYVLLDCPPSLGLLTLNALVAAEEVLLPTSPLRVVGAEDDYPAQRPGIRGAEPGPVGDQLRPGVQRSDRVHGGGPGAGVAVSGRPVVRGIGERQWLSKGVV